MRLLLSGGGTGGHIYPALALAEGMRQELPDSKIMFVGARGGMEEKIIPAAGFKLRTLNISGIDRSSLRNAAASLVKIPGALKEAKHLVKEFRPDVVVGTGGYASFPVVYAATRQGIPAAIHEQNAYPGIANRILASRVDLVMVTFAEAGDRLKAHRLVTTGLPVREAVLAASKSNPLTAKIEQPFTILAFGGSQGAQVINQAVWELLGLVTKPWRIIWVTGRNSYEEWKSRLNQANQFSAKVEIHPYLDDIEKAMKDSHLAICRAGASTLAELTVMGLPAILIPFPLAAENHQEINARSLEAAGAARVVINSELNGTCLEKEISTAQAQLENMAAAMRSRAILEARSHMVALVRELKIGRHT